MVAQEILAKLDGYNKPSKGTSYPRREEKDTQVARQPWSDT